MKNRDLKTYIYWGVTAVCVIAVCIVLNYVVRERQAFMGILRMVAGILAPITYGAVLAYLTAPVYNGAREFCERTLRPSTKSEKKLKRAGKVYGTITSLLLVCVVIFGLLRLLLPQIWESISGLNAALPTYIENLYMWIRKLLEDNPEFESMVLSNLTYVLTEFQDWGRGFFTRMDAEWVGTFISSLSSGVMTAVTQVMNALIGLIVMVYLLNIKELLAGQGKKIIYSLFPVKIANDIVSEIRFVHKVFGGFIIGKLVDSLIIGILCFLCLSFMDMPYYLLISVIVGVTNVIPFFGPFIGAIPSAFLVLLVSPMKCLYFLIFILLLQQFDGNILGPKILGDSTGLPSFWVLFSILLFGGLFGFVGMIIGVPTCAVIFDLISKAVTKSLKAKNLSEETEDYLRLDHVDEESGKFISR